MHIKYVEIQNFKKLKSCRIELTDETTLFVGANNSGKTSAFDALRKFLDEKNDFTINDFTLSNWIEINKIGNKWLNSSEGLTDSLIEEFNSLVPTMDVWLHVEDHEIHYVTHLIPSLDWNGGSLGVRLRMEPKNIEKLYKDFFDSSKSAKNTLDALRTKEGTNLSISLWPKDLRDYLSRKFHTHFGLKCYILDPEKCMDPQNGVAQPQVLLPGSESIEGDPFKRLFLIHKINAQRGFTDPNNKSNEDDGSASRIVGNLSAQLRAYYNIHLNPTLAPDLTDIGALQAIEEAQKTFDDKLRQGFNSALLELESLGYPGFSDPKITISTKIKPVDGLNHDSAVQFELIPKNNQNANLSLRLPEQYNGLGYQNLISIIFKLMQFRDEWMKVGKLAKDSSNNVDDFFIPPLHIVLIEEPEAHLHMQVQQVFIRQAYNVLRNHKNLGNNVNLKTQLIVSTHSGHIAHEMPFSNIRYFRRKALASHNEVPSSTVINLSNVFGKEEQTERFVTRYLQLTHYDLFFADAAILVEGPAERILLPYFIRKHFRKLSQMYISLLEIGGSHAHRLRPLIEALGLTTLIITDLDSSDPKNKLSATPTKRNENFLTGNDTLKSWVPCETHIDNLLDLTSEMKVKEYDGDNYSVRVAYQTPIIVSDFPLIEALPYTFEDALVFENISLFKKFEGNGLMKKFNEAINTTMTIPELAERLFGALREGKKAEFALQLIYLEEIDTLKLPTYINEGLTWLEKQLKKSPWEFSINKIGDRAEEKMVNS